MIDLLDDNSDCAAIDRALREDEAGKTIPGETVNAILDGATPLKAWRQYREFTLEMLADRIGVSKEHLLQIENGQKSGTVDISRRLSTILDVELEDLVE
ncbi:MAG: helix-turn-helix transcriptional regulator [Gemmatimonadetes bacterium]|nr:helix-turn-helix transcriptional regulator [Gemmatimonadota bacterium]